MVVLTATFFLLRQAPGDPTQIRLDPRVSAAQRSAQQRLYGLDQPLAQQYGAWLLATVRGDWGVSFSHHRPVASVLAGALPATIQLALAATVVQFGLGLWLGLTCARRRGSWPDRLLQAGSLALYSVPEFWLALMAMLLLVYRWPIFPSPATVAIATNGVTALVALRALTLPALVLGVSGAAGVARYLRARLAAELGQAYVRTARAKGVPEWRILWKHALANAAAPAAQLLGSNLPHLLSGVLIVEVIFSRPGLGRLTYQAILSRDYPLVLAATALSATLVIVGNLLADLFQAWLDPRARYV